MDVLEAIVLGLIEGLTEYLPVSSTGHLILAQRGLGIPHSPEANAFAICIQAGAIVAVLLLYRGRVSAMTRGLLGRDAAGRRLAFAVGTAFLPAAAAGLLLGEEIEQRLFGLWPVVAAWAMGGIAILVVARFVGRAATGRSLEEMTPRLALWIGLAQCLALWPGTSRSLVTILAGVLGGLRLTAAVEFSFLLGLVTLGAATVYKAALTGGLLWETYGALPLLAGFLAAAFAAFLSVRWLVSWLSAHGLGVFGWYRLALAAVVAAFLLAN